MPHLVPYLRKAVRYLIRDETAATMAEYALMLALLALVCVAAVEALGTGTSTFFSDAAAKVAEAGP
jgi:Flp pilus assembly pilin Flp